MKGLLFFQTIEEEAGKAKFAFDSVMPGKYKGMSSI